MNPPSTFFMHVNYPVNQLLFNRGDTTIIYYPDSKEGFKFISNYSNTPDVSKGIIPVFKDEYLTKLGMVLVKSDYRKGKLIKFYSPVNAQSPLKFIKIVYKNHLIYSIEVIDKKDKVLKRSLYENYKSIDKKNIPMTVRNFSSIGKDSIIKEIDYDSIIVIKNIPDSIAKYKVPADVKLKEVKW